MDYLNIEKVKKKLKKEVAGYSSVSTSSFLENMGELLDIIEYLLKENEALKEKSSKPIIKEKIVYRKR